jgi:hypothetical protein
LVLLEITPIEYSKDRIVRYYGYKILNINLDMLNEYIRNGNFRTLPNIWQEEDTVFYEYPNKPLIIIKDGKLFTTQEIWDSREFSQAEIRHQASLVLRILNGAECATYNRKAVPKKKFTPTKFRPYSKRYQEIYGENKEEGSNTA